MPFCSSALTRTSADKPPAIRRPTRKPNGAVPERTPAAVTAERRILSSFKPPDGTPGFLNVLLPDGVTGNRAASTRLPILPRKRPLWENVFHCTPSSRPASRLASMKRTSSMTCWGCSTATELITSGPNCRAMTTALSSVAASGVVPDSMMRPLTDVTLSLAYGKRFDSTEASMDVSWLTSTSNTPISFLFSP